MTRPDPTRPASAAISALLLASALTLSPAAHAQLDLDGGGEVWHLDVSGLPGVGDNDYFGDSTAIGDLNGDGHPDLVIGAWGRDGAEAYEGVVYVLYSGPGGPGGGTMRQLITEDHLDAGDGSEAFDYFGYSVAVGNFDADAYDDLVIGILGEDVNGDYAGAFVVLSGGPGTVSFTGVKYFDQDDLSGTLPEPGDFLGEVFAVGNFDGDAYDDLAVGVPFEDVSTTADSGMVHVLYGSAGGLTAVGHQTLRPGANGLPGAPGEDDRFGAALAAGDLNDDGKDELVVGEPGDDSGAGKVHVLFGSSGGLLTGGLYLEQEDFDGLPSQSGSGFGTSVAIGNFDGDQLNDLAIGAPDYDVFIIDEEFPGAGAVSVGYSSIFGFQETFTFIQWDFGDPSESGDRFGARLAAGDIDADGIDDLVVTALAEDTGAGRVHVAPGTDEGLEPLDSQVFGQGAFAIPGTAENGDTFGWSLTLGDLDGDGGVDLVVGVPGEDFYDGQPGETIDAGQVHVLYSVTPLVFADGFESGDTSAWQ